MDVQDRGRRRLTAALAAVVTAFTGLVLAPPAGAADVLDIPASGSWTVAGRGWGHGIGMSQWGAQGAALQGVSTAAILDFYYPGTTDFDIGQDYPLRVRLLSLAGASARIAPSSGSLVLTDLSTGAATTLAAGGQVVVTRSGGLFQATVGGAAVQIAGSSAFAGPMQVSGAQASEVWALDSSGAGRLYAGSVRLNATGTAALEVVNHVPMEQYLRGVVPQEVSSSWDPAALRAQAIAARSYALAVRSTTGTADLCDTTACQVYGGLASRTSGGTVTTVTRATTDTAISATARIARYYGGGPAFTQFSSTNGGYTKAGSRPYLVAKADPYTGTAPGDTRTRWTDTLTVARVQQSCPSGGTLQRMVLNRDGNGDLGGRITSAQLQCSTGTVTVATPAFGLLSSWWIPTSVNQPFGNFEVAETASGGVRVKGWAIDPDTGASIDVRVNVGGTVTTVRASTTRNDVAAVYPSAGAAHGFDAVVPGSGSTACVTLVNVGVGADTELGCRTITVSTVGTPPFGSFDSASAAPGAGEAGPVVTVSGWTADSDAPQTSLGVRATVDGTVVASATADGARSDVAAALPGFGAAHGYAVSFTAAPGARQVCVLAVDTAHGSNTSFGCRTVTVPGGSPFGNWEVAQGVQGGVQITGWAIDPDTTASPYVWVEVDGVGHYLRASTSRSDVGNAYPAYGSSFGFTEVAVAGRGTHQVCVTISNTGAGGNTSLGCRQVTVP
jgi:SpoIID/LytB domain protein